MQDQPFRPQTWTIQGIIGISAVILAAGAGLVRSEINQSYLKEELMSVKSDVAAMKAESKADHDGLIELKQDVKFTRQDVEFIRRAIERKDK